MRLYSSFTLIELVFVIVISALLGVATFNMGDDSLLLARDQLIKDIKYTQSLALFDVKYRHKPKSSDTKDMRQVKFWYKSMWQLRIGQEHKRPYYAIFSDKPTNAETTNFDGLMKNNKSEPAIDPETRKYLVGVWRELYSSPSYHLKKSEVTTRLNLGLEYGVEKVEANTTFGGKWQKNSIRILFDNFGRPFYYYNKGDNGDYHPFRYLLQEEVQIKLSKGDDEVCFNIHPITGYVSLPKNGCNF